MITLKRLRDWLHERYIKRLQRRFDRCMQAGDKPMSRMVWNLFVDAVRRRSPEQVARMEKKMGIKHA